VTGRGILFMIKLNIWQQKSRGLHLERLNELVGEER
jgi:hypothetical protein